ncbi:hypothetical protein SUGI_0326480 [Cryptomeria japonica]|uniref:transcription factor MYB102 n=1 Tax=Cryptomeria japonica TaxID=3369 RepID=UPI002408C7E4|nr:transcription factor MYB102 [Cryptomeria japonica]GLJ18424.1 hypothetical protein SUGI_0326480 [Cryptomeria japonica]
MGRIPCCEKDNVKRGQWTPEEDAKLVSYISQHGTRNWRLIPKNAGLQRCGKSCRLRWTNYLRPDLKHGEFTDNEEQTIVKLHSVVGNRWSLIAAQLPGRTDNDVKNHWNTKLKKKLSGMGIDPVTHKPFSHLMAEIANTLAPPQVAHLAEAALGCFKDEMLHLLTKKRIDWRAVDPKGTIVYNGMTPSQFSPNRIWDLPQNNNMLCHSKDDVFMSNDNAIKQGMEQSDIIMPKPWETHVSPELNGFNSTCSLYTAFQFSGPEYRSPSLYMGGSSNKAEVNFPCIATTNPWGMARGSPGHMDNLDRTSNVALSPTSLKQQEGVECGNIWNQVECNDNGGHVEEGSSWNQSMCSGSTCTGGDQCADLEQQEVEEEEARSDGGGDKSRQGFNSECVLWDLSDDLITPII